jgi:hypothetical protein
MPIVATDWSIDRATGNVRYIGDDHEGASPSYATVIQLHRFLQDLADDASSSGDDEVDITDENPTNRSTDNIITLLGNYNIDDITAEHLYDGSILQKVGDADETIWDGIVNFGNAGILIQIHQAGIVLEDDFWNANGGLNPDAGAGISHRFMLKVKGPAGAGGIDIDGRRLIGTARTYGNTFAEFSINGTSRGNNVLALTDSADLNNVTASGIVENWGDINNVTEGYVLLDVDNDTVDEPYYSEWDRAARTINEFYEHQKLMTSDGTQSGLYGINGELFRGITHQVPLADGGSGTFDAVEPVHWGDPITDGTILTNVTGSGQMFAIDTQLASTAQKLWIQMLSGVVPVQGQAISGLISTAVVAMDSPSTVTPRTISKPFIGQSTGGALIGAYGVGLETADLTASDLLTDLDGNPVTPPNNVIFTVAGLVSGEDRVLVGPWDGTSTDAEGFPAIDKDQLAVAVTSLTGAETSVEVSPAIPTDTPGSGVVRITTDAGNSRHVPYQSYTGSVFTFWTTHDFTADNATIGNNVWIGYIDRLADAGSETFTSVFLADRDLVVLVRDGGGTPIKQFISSAKLETTGGSITAIRTTDL